MNVREQRIALYALGAPGAKLCRRLAARLDGAEVFLPQRHADPGAGEHPFDSLHQVLAENFHRYSEHALVCAAAMVVRCIAPLLRHKASDPAVVVIDQQGRYAVSLLSGHLGGANELARRVAQALNGQAVITTATDNLGLPSLELEARRLGLAVENLGALAGVSSSLVDGRPVPLCDPQGWLEPVTSRHPECFTPVSPEQAQGMVGVPLVRVSWQHTPTAGSWLVLRPRCLALGMGCNRGTGADELEALARSALELAGAAVASLRVLASAAAKRGEGGLLLAARRLGVEMAFYDHQELSRVEVPNPSPAALRCLGTASVCEAAALLASDHGQLILPKIKSKNATAAVAIA